MSKLQYPTSTTLQSSNINSAFAALKNEYVLTKGAGKHILLAMFFQIPLITWLPYVSQAFTIILLSFFLKHLRTSKSRIEEAVQHQKVGYRIRIDGFYLVIATMAFQVLWFPFFSQLVSLLLLGFIYGTMTKYRD